MANTPIEPTLTDSSQYQTVAASTTQACGPSGGGANDYLAGVTIIPGTLAAGAVSIKDGSTSISIFVSGTLADLKPFFVPIGAASLNGGWSVVTGANVTAIARGRFT